MLVSDARKWTPSTRSLLCNRPSIVFGYRGKPTRELAAYKTKIVSPRTSPDNIEHHNTTRKDRSNVPSIPPCAMVVGVRCGGAKGAVTLPARRADDAPFQCSPFPAEPDQPDMSQTHPKAAPQNSRNKRERIMMPQFRSAGP